MPDWLQTLINLVSVIGLGTIGWWVYSLGRLMGKHEQRLDDHDKDIKDIKGSVAACPPREECTELFRQVSIGISELKGQMAIVLQNVRDMRNRTGQ